MKSRPLAALSLALALALSPVGASAADAHQGYRHWWKSHNHSWDGHKRHHHGHHKAGHRKPRPTASPTSIPTPSPSITVTPTPTPSASATTPTTTPPATGGTTGGTGGAFANRTEVEFTSNGMTSQYHIYAEGRTGTPGLLFWVDGSGGHGFDNPEDDYLIGGPNGMDAIAKARNMILVVPVAPAPGCPSDNCWYDDNGPAKAKWSSDLMTAVKKQYPVRLDRIAIGGYSSGAQWTTNFFMPAHGEAQSVDLFMPFAYGGPPRSTPNWSAEYKAKTFGVWNTGTADPAIGNARNGYDAYTRAGFRTQWEQSSSSHSRGGEFGRFAAENIDEFLAK